MAKTVQPLNVSPLIKGVRWSLLLAGIFYGSQKYIILKKYEAKQSIIRMQKYREEEKREAEEIRRKNIVEIENMAREFEITEFPHGWSDSI